MARRIFPNDENRLVYGYTAAGEALTSKSGTTVRIFSDSGCTTLADIQTLAGATISGSLVPVDANSLMEKFKGPDGTPYGLDTLYGWPSGSVDTAEQFAIHSIYDDRLDLDTFIKCTSSTRPTTPTDDQMIYETDTGKLLYYDTASTKWLSVKKAYTPDVVEVVANSAAVSAETTIATSSTIAADGQTKFDITGCWAGFTSTVATDIHEYRLYEDSTLIAAVSRYANSTTANAGDGGTVIKRGRQPSAGNKVYTLRIIRLTGTGTITNLASSTKPTTIEVKEA